MNTEQNSKYLEYENKLCMNRKYQRHLGKTGYMGPTLAALLLNSPT